MGLLPARAMWEERERQAQNEASHEIVNATMMSTQNAEKACPACSAMLLSETMDPF
jgi:hypothetical protein